MNSNCLVNIGPDEIDLLSILMTLSLVCSVCWTTTSNV